MNCDEAFDVITSSHARDSERLHEHLDGCRRCQQMFQTLEPALALFAIDSESTPETTSSRESTDWQAAGRSQLATHESVRMAHDSATQLTLDTSTPKRRKLSRLDALLRYAAFFLFGVATAVWGVKLSSHSPTSSLPVSASLDSHDDCLWHSQPTQTQIAANAAIIQCVGCHSDPKLGMQRNDQHPDSDPQSIVLSCVACHQANSPPPNVEVCLWSPESG